MYKVTFIPGDGIGPEVSEAAKRCIEATGVKINWDVLSAGEEARIKEGTPLPDDVIESIKRNKVAIKGPIITPVGGGFRSVNVEMRKRLDLYACLRPCKSYPGVRSRYENIDLVVVRENTEDLYAGIEFERETEEANKIINEIEKAKGVKIGNGSSISIKPISRFASQRIARFAFDYALKNNRRKVTAVHKANIMKYTDGLFLDTVGEVAKEYAGKIEFEDRIIDNMCMQLVQRPEAYDVLVLPNLYGDIVSDLCAGLVGGLGIAPGANIGEGLALFEPVHGSAPKYKGKNKVNPTAMILCGVLMLRYLGEMEAAHKLEEATKEVIKAGKDVTYDLKENRDDPTAAGTAEMASAIIEKLR